jgi:hypothetical protein
MLDERTGALDPFHAPLYTVPEAARYLDVPASTLNAWTHGYRRKSTGRKEVTGAPVLTAIRSTRKQAAVIPFVGLAEGLVLTAMRHSGVPLQRIRPALAPSMKRWGFATLSRPAGSIPMVQRCYLTTLSEATIQRLPERPSNLSWFEMVSTSLQKPSRRTYAVWSSAPMDTSA